MISISESEWQVMQVIWSSPPKTLPEILSSLQSTGWSKTTIQTYLARLVKKGALTTQRQGKGYLYYPALSQAQCQLEERRAFSIGSTAGPCLRWCWALWRVVAFPRRSWRN